MKNDMFSDAAIYQSDVADICLNCPHKQCYNMNLGCDAFREAFKKISRQSKHNHPRKSSKKRRGGATCAGKG